VSKSSISAINAFRFSSNKSKISSVTGSVHFSPHNSSFIELKFCKSWSIVGVSGMSGAGGNVKSDKSMVSFNAVTFVISNISLTGSRGGSLFVWVEMHFVGMLVWTIFSARFAVIVWDEESALAGANCVPQLAEKIHLYQKSYKFRLQNVRSIVKAGKSEWSYRGVAYKDWREIWVACPVLSFLFTFCVARPISVLQNFLVCPLLQKKNDFWPVLLSDPLYFRGIPFVLIHFQSEFSGSRDFLAPLRLLKSGSYYKIDPSQKFPV